MITTFPAFFLLVDFSSGLCVVRQSIYDRPARIPETPPVHMTIPSDDGNDRHPKQAQAAQQQTYCN
jgi:hypothetical protein